MKKFICIFLLLTLSVTLTGCKGDSPGDALFTSGRFVLVSNDSGEAVFYDSETMVMYLMVYNVYRCGITVLLNQDGTPMLYEGVD